MITGTVKGTVTGTVIVRRTSNDACASLITEQTGD